MPVQVHEQIRADAPTAVQERGKQVVPELYQLVGRHRRQEPGRQLDLLEEHHDLDHQHRDHAGEDPLPRVRVVLAKSKHPGHDAPRGIKDGHLY